MKKFLILVLAAFFCMLGTAHATLLSNTQLIFNPDFYPNNFNTSTYGPVISAEIDIGNDGINDGKVWSAVVQSLDEDYFMYLYSIELYDDPDNNSNTTHVIKALSVNWGPIAPLAFDFDGAGSTTYSALDDSWYGTHSDGWNDIWVNDNWPQGGADYSGGTVSWSWFGAPVAEGTQSSWVMTMSQYEPNIVVPNILDGGPPESLGQVYSPVPEPATMLLLGSGLIGLGALGRKKFFKK